MPRPLDKYEKQHVARIKRLNQQVKDLYNAAINEITITAGRMTFNGKPFSLSQYPVLDRKVQQVLSEMHGKIYTTVVNGIKEAWADSNEKNNIMIDRRLGGTKAKLPAKLIKVWYDPNLPALQRFLKRKTNGLNLSDRVWKLTRVFKKEMEQSLGLGIAEGKPAKDMARDMKKYLNEPEKLFRRVRGVDGKLNLSKAAREYHPGQGVYRSSYKNALRLTRTETNMSYRNADMNRWEVLPIVHGFEVRLSISHPKFDICDSMVGKYPKSFVFVGWHAQCLCYAVPIVMSDKDYNIYEDNLLGLSNKLPPNRDVLEPPKGFKKYLSDNAEKIKKLKNRPYWINDNPAFT